MKWGKEMEKRHIRFKLHKEIVFTSIATAVIGVFIIKSTFLMNLFWMIASYIGLETRIHWLVFAIVLVELALCLFLVYIAVWSLLKKVPS